MLTKVSAYFCFQIYLILKAEVLVVEPVMLEGFPVLKSLFDFSDPDEPPIFELPEMREFSNGLQLLKTLIVFLTEGDKFTIPATHKELLALVRLADFVDCDSFLQAAARWLNVSMDAIANHNPIGKVHQLIRGCYHAARHHRRDLPDRPSVCCYCQRLIVPAVPCKIEMDLTPCCQHPVHSYCKSPRVCPVCSKLLAVLPCAVCNLTISSGEDYAHEYVIAFPHRTPCCGGDCHEECKTDDFRRCPLCQCPLNKWEIDTDMQMAGDVLAARRMTGLLNGLRMKDDLQYDDVMVVYHPRLPG